MSFETALRRAERPYPEPFPPPTAISRSRSQRQAGAPLTRAGQSRRSRKSTWATADGSARTHRPAFSPRRMAPADRQRVGVRQHFGWPGKTQLDRHVWLEPCHPRAWSRRARFCAATRPDLGKSGDLASAGAATGVPGRRRDEADRDQLALDGELARRARRDRQRLAAIDQRGRLALMIERSTRVSRAPASPASRTARQEHGSTASTAPSRKVTWWWRGSKARRAPAPRLLAQRLGDRAARFAARRGPSPCGGHNSCPQRGAQAGHDAGRRLGHSRRRPPW